MNNKERLINYFLSGDFDGIQNSGYTWNELGELYGFSGEAARSIWRRCKDQKKTFGNNTEDKLKQFCKENGIDYNNVVKAKYITHNNNPTFNLTLDRKSINKGFIQEIQETLEKIFDIDTTVEKIVVPEKYSNNILALNISDLHIGMDIPKSFYGFVWNKESLISRLSTMCAVVDNKIKKYKPEHLMLNVLGDVTDGQDNMTTRGIKGNSKHKLPQNMTNKEMYEVALEFFLKLISYLDSYNFPITFNYISNSNHGGIIDYSIGATLKKVIDIKYSNIQFNLQDDFINHINLGNIDLLTTHGYDEEFVSKFNKMPMHLDHKWLLRVKNYIKKFKCKGDLKLLLRGDLHRYNTCSYQDFEDIMIPAFCPPSTYAQSNFDSDLSKSGFTIINISKQDYSKDVYYFE